MAVIPQKRPKVEVIMHFWQHGSAQVEEILSVVSVRTWVYICVHDYPVIQQIKKLNIEVS